VTSADLYALVNALLAEAQKLPDDECIGLGAINWADLACVQVAHVTEYHPPQADGWLVWIEEAEPGCDLCDWLTGRLAERGVADVEVMAEW
jgi:hypothetical protein